MEFFGKKEKANFTDKMQNVAALSEISSENTKILSDIERFVDYIVRVLVDKPDAIQTAIEKDDKGLLIIRISCEKGDIGKIIGKNGKTITAIRTLAGNAGVRAGVRLSVELSE
jgi:predicted RNA-binding protein YlqC (UPF0109 family)